MVLYFFYGRERNFKGTMQAFSNSIAIYFFTLIPLTMIKGIIQSFSADEVNAIIMIGFTTLTFILALVGKLIQSINMDFDFIQHRKKMVKLTNVFLFAMIATILLFAEWLIILLCLAGEGSIAIILGGVVFFLLFLIIIKAALESLFEIHWKLPVQKMVYAIVVLIVLTVLLSVIL